MEEILKYVYEFLEKEGEFNTKEKNIKVLREYFALDEILAEKIYNDWKKKFMKAKYEVSEV